MFPCYTLYDSQAHIRLSTPRGQLTVPCPHEHKIFIQLSLTCVAQPIYATCSTKTRFKTFESNSTYKKKKNANGLRAQVQNEIDHEM